MFSSIKTLGIDLDDVVIDFNTALCEWHNRHYGTSYERKDIVSYELAGLWKCTRDEARRRVFDFYNTIEHHLAPPVQGAIEGLHVLKKKNTLVGATSRPKAVRDLTLKWLRRQTLEVFDVIYFLGHYHGPAVERSISKAEVCREVRTSLFIDDSLAHATSIACAGIPVLLFDTPWNQGAIPELVTRVSGWDEILEKTA
ncbi:MAG: 5' nucleotidase, NT5C type [Minisyncoccota bacterium]